LVEAVGPSGEVVGVEISPEVSINAKRRIESNHWCNVQVVEGDARTVQLNGTFDAMLLMGVPDAYASSQAVENLFRYLRDDVRIVAFGAKLSHRRLGRMLNWLTRSFMKLSFSSTPELSYQPWDVLETRLAEERPCLLPGANLTSSVESGQSLAITQSRSVLNMCR
jgi:tRNA A58 N-methylase Trm61